MAFVDWTAYCLIWTIIGIFIVAPLLIIIRTIIINEIIKAHEVDLSDSIITSITAGAIVFIASLFLMRLVFL